MSRIGRGPYGPVAAPVAAGDARDHTAEVGTRRPRLYREVLLIGVCYGLYSLVRDLVPAQHLAALSFANRLLGAERLLHINVELSINRLFTDERWLGAIGGYYYSSLHWVITVGVLAWLYTRHPDRYVVYRRLIFGTTIVGLLGFWLFPLAPPRMLPGYVDTAASFHTWGLYASSSAVGAVSNQYAAMPSLHTGWALWCAIAVVDVARRRWAQVLAICYPIATVVVILGTANHYVLDAVGGGVALGAGYACTLAARATIPHLGPLSRVFSRC